MVLVPREDFLHTVIDRYTRLPEKPSFLFSLQRPGHSVCILHSSTRDQPTFRQSLSLSLRPTYYYSLRLTLHTITSKNRLPFSYLILLLSYKNSLCLHSSFCFLVQTHESQTEFTFLTFICLAHFPSTLTKHKTSSSFLNKVTQSQCNIFFWFFKHSFHFGFAKQP